MSKIRSEVEELKAIERELKVLREKASSLRKRKEALEHNITEFLKAKEQTGMQDGDSNIILKDKVKPSPKKAKDRLNDAVSVLQKYGIRQAEKVLEELLQARKGEPTYVTKVKIEKLRQKKE